MVLLEELQGIQTEFSDLIEDFDMFFWIFTASQMCP